MPDESAFHVQLVTPERILVSGLATEVILRTGEGDITFLAGHAPLVGSVEPGVLRIVGTDGSTERVATHGGFVQVESGVDLQAEEAEGSVGGGPGTGAPATGTRVTLLIGVAELAGEIDVERARAALERAQSRVSELAGTGGRTEQGEPSAELAEAEGALRRAEVRIEATEAPSAVAG